MALLDSVTTCLSQPVHYAICKLGFEKKDTYDINNILSGNGEVCWQAVAEHVCYLESGWCLPVVVAIHLRLIQNFNAVHSNPSRVVTFCYSAALALLQIRVCAVYIYKEL